jgi:fatty-acyl-CoA synthase
MNLADIGRHWARWQPDAVAITYAGSGTTRSQTTWRDLDRRTDELAAGLRKRGIKFGDRIAIMMLNRPEWVELTVAALKLGAVIVPLNVRFTAREVAFVVGDADCRMVVGEQALSSALTEVSSGTEVLMVEELAGITVGGATVEPVPTPDTAPAFLCYTSGTKGAVLTHGSWNVASQGWSQAIQLTAQDRVVLPFPLAFTGGLAVFLFTYWTGARLVLEPAVDVDRLFDLFEIERVTALLAVPVIHQQLVDHPRFATADLSSWRIACSGGAPVPVPLLHAIQARGIPMLQGFSLTEASAAATILPGHDALTKVGSAGLPVIHGSISIAREDGTGCAPGEIGEILVGGPQIMTGYWNNPIASEAALAGGLLHTGDLGYLDDDGYLYVVDRMKDMLITGGLNVYPAEIERALISLAGIIEVAVIGVPDDRWGETPAVIAYTAGATVTGHDVLSACRASLADYKLPRYLVVVDRPLPRNMSGKILKRELKVTYAALASSATPIR